MVATTRKAGKKHPIDAVILWVDGGDERHREKILPFLDNKNRASSRKFRTRYDQVNEIEFTINSILKFAPYIDNIYIVTDNQVPAFLGGDRGHGKCKRVRVIDHRTIFAGYQQHLPTFNCRSIETCLFRIPELAEHFIYFNDDFFLVNETQPEDFFRDGLPVLRGKWLEFDENIFHKRFRKPRAGHKNIQQNAAKIAGAKKYYNFRHTPHPLRKSTLDNYFRRNEAVLIENIRHKFRNNRQFAPQGLANHLEILNKSCVLMDDLQLLYFRSYDKPLLWHKLKLNVNSRRKLFLSMQSLDQCPQRISRYLMAWLEQRMQFEEKA